MTQQKTNRQGQHDKLFVAIAIQFLIRTYRVIISPALGPKCRHLPTCSEFALEAFEQHGFWCALRLSAGRILRCHPWGTSGYDPVPLAPGSQTNAIRGNPTDLGHPAKATRMA